MLSHGKLNLSYFFGGAENCVDLLHISVAEIAEENNLPRVLEKYAPGVCEHRFSSQTKTRGDRNCTACFSLANIFNQSTNKSFGAKLQSEVTGGFT